MRAVVKSTGFNRPLNTDSRLLIFLVPLVASRLVRYICQQKHAERNENQMVSQERAKRVSTHQAKQYHV